MKLLVFSDIHSDLRALGRLMDMEADYYFAAGDMTSWARGLEAVGKVLARRAPRVWVLPGNHESEADIERMCERNGLNPFHGKVIEAGSWKIAGLGYSTPTPFNTPGEYSEREMAGRLSPFTAIQPLVLICHCPPRNTAVDRIREGAHGGSAAVLEFIERYRPEYFFCGHIHEAEGAETTIGTTRAYNCGKRGRLLELP